MAPEVQAVKKSSKRGQKVQCYKTYGFSERSVSSALNLSQQATRTLAAAPSQVAFSNDDSRQEVDLASMYLDTDNTLLTA